MLNDVACNDIVYSVSIMTLGIFCKNKKRIAETGWYCMVSYICYITVIESD